MSRRYAKGLTYRSRLSTGYSRTTKSLETWQRAEEKTDAKNESAENAPKIASEPPEDEGRQKPLLDEISALNQKIDALQKALDDKEQERKALFVQNGQLLFLLSQEKQEKQALLPSPKKPILERIKRILKKDQQPEN